MEEARRAHAPSRARAGCGEDDVIRADSNVRQLLKPSPKDAAEQRLAVRKAAGRVIRAYKRNKEIHPNDAVVCALSAAQIIDIMERALRPKIAKQQARGWA